MLGFPHNLVCIKNTRKHPFLLYLNCLETSKEWSCVYMNFIMDIPGLKGVVLKKVEQVDEKMQMHIEMEKKLHRCPQCKNWTKRVHDYRIQKIQHLKWFERTTLLFYKRRRYACPCGKRFSEKNPFVEHYQRTSIEWNQAVSIRNFERFRAKILLSHQYKRNGLHIG